MEAAAIAAAVFSKTAERNVFLPWPRVSRSDDMLSKRDKSSRPSYTDSSARESKQHDIFPRDLVNIVQRCRGGDRPLH
jgi:hypothetical protein